MDEETDQAADQGAVDRDELQVEISLGQLPSCWADKQSLVGVEGLHVRDQGSRERLVTRSRTGECEEEGRRTWAESDRSSITSGQFRTIGVGNPSVPFMQKAGTNEDGDGPPNTSASRSAAYQQILGPDRLCEGLGTPHRHGIFHQGISAQCSLKRYASPAQEMIWLECLPVRVSGTFPLPLSADVTAPRALRVDSRRPPTECCRQPAVRHPR